jgi:ribosomal protein S12 methylthiotransferase accessory factor
MNNQMQIEFGNGKRVLARYNGFEIHTDQNPSSGGEGSAPEPYDLFLASLATCAGYYVASFCEKRNIPHHDLALTQTWLRGEDGKIETIRLEIQVPSTFPEKYYGALVRAANLCSVKKTLDRPPAFEVETVVS